MGFKAKEKSVRKGERENETGLIFSILELKLELQLLHMILVGSMGGR